MKQITGILIFFLGCFHAQAIELKSAALLNKMSMTLTGKPAATADQFAVSKITNDIERNAFIDQKMPATALNSELSPPASFLKSAVSPKRLVQLTPM